MLAKTETVALIGAEARRVEVEVDVADSGLPCFRIVGLPTKSVREAEQRTRCALTASRAQWPQRRIVANLAPGELPKEGTHFDLAIAMGILAATGGVNRELLEGWTLLGELGLDGSVRPVRGTLAVAISCRQANRRGLVCPAATAPEAAVIQGLRIVPVETFEQCVAFFNEEWEPPLVKPAPPLDWEPHDDLRDVRGHGAAKEVLEVAAAGGHNVLFQGPPGSGKTMLAKRFPGILPPMSFDESLEVTRIHSIAGLLKAGALITQRPFRAPHHHISVAGLIGGGSGLARPGEISLAHHGTLFLDELSLFRREALDALRAPLEEGVVRISRSAGAVVYDCSLSLIAATNPCPCGFDGDDRRVCQCADETIRRYKARLPGPLMDRIDLQVIMRRVGRNDLLGPPRGASSPTVRHRVEVAREIQAVRYGSTTLTNASAPGDLLKSHLALTPAARADLGAAIEGVRLSGRGVDRILRVSRTIADLQASAEVTPDHIGYALANRLHEVDVEVAA